MAMSTLGAFAHSGWEGGRGWGAGRGGGGRVSGGAVFEL